MFDPPALVVRLARLQYSRRRASFVWMSLAFKRVLLLMLVHTSLALSAFATCMAPKNSIETENCLPGNSPSEWYINGAGSSNIVGFTTDISVNVGQTVTFKISTNASSWRIDIYRLGYYQGNGARFITSVSPLTSISLPQIQPACLSDSATGLVDCGTWLPSATWAVPSTATSGIYFARLIRLDTLEASPALFVVRNDSSHSDILVQTSDETWHAYNVYGGSDLYTGNPHHKVSYNRPFQVSNGNTWPFTSEIPMIRWLEANGYDLSYFTGVDTDRNGALITQHKIFMSVAHDEYWSGGQRANVETARAAGVNLAFFSGNEIFFKTRWEPSIDGTSTPYRTLVCYKETFDNAVTDPADPPIWTGIWQDGRFSPPADGGRPENALSGTKTGVSAPPNPPSYPINVPQADGKMRFWRNTSMAMLGPGQVGTLPTGVLGYEWDEDADNGFRPPGLIRLSTTTESVSNYLTFDPSPPPGTYSFPPGTATHHLTMYRAPSGALVFGAGTIQWSWGLDATHDLSGTPTDLNMQQATVNILADMGVQPASLQTQGGVVAATASTDTTPPSSTITSPPSGSNVSLGSSVTISGTAMDFGGGVVGGVEISVDGGTTWHPAVGRENWTYTTTFNNNATVNIRSRAVDDSGNLEVPGPGITITVGTPAPPPSVSSVNPTSGAQGQNLSSVLISGSGFQNGATCSFGAGITVNSCTFNSATQLTANITISPTAALGSRNVTVTNPDGQSNTLPNGFTVTSSGPPPPPPTPTGLTATAGNAQVSLAWNASTGAASYNLYRSVNGAAYSQLNTSPITTTSYTDIGLTNGTPYCYEVTAVNSSGESAKSSPACATPQPPPPPPAISLIQKATFSRQPTSSGTVTLTLPQATAAGHTLIVGMSFWPLDISSVTDGSGDAFTRGLTTSIFHNVSGSDTYTNFYYAKSTAGGTTALTLNFSGGSTYLLLTVAEVAGLDPAVPLDQSAFHESLTATAAWSSAAVTTTAANEYLFSWAATEAGNPSCSSPATGWTIESQTNDPNGATVCWLDRIVSATGSYQASVTASTAQNYAMEIATFKGNVPSGPPPTPTGLMATAGNAQVSLAWNASTGAASYNLYRSVNGGVYSQLNTSPISTTSYTNSGLTNGTPYCYEVTAVNSSGESSRSSPVCATPQPPPPPPTPTGLAATAGNAQVSLAWNASTGAASYNLYRSVNGGAYSQLNTSPITTTSHTDSGLTNGTPYCYEVTAVNSSGESSRSSPVCATPQPPPPPPTPTGLTATAGNAQVSLAWNASTGAASYNLYRSVNGAAYSQLNTSPITTTSHTDSGLTNGTPYCYEVTAVNSSGGESAKSSPACATPQPPPPPPAISLIQKATFSREPTAGGTVTLTLPQATAAGHTLIVGMSFWPLDISSVTDGSGDAFTRGLTTSIFHNVSGSDTYTNFYYAKSTAGGTTALTLNFSGGSTYLLLTVAEVAGLDPAVPLDQSAFHESLTATAAWSSAAVTTTAANEYLFSWAATEAGNPPCSSPASGWTIDSQTNDANGATVCLLDRIVSATGSYQASVTASTAQNYAMEIVTFK
jgi:fibronectin type 3 domain-containing protein